MVVLAVAAVWCSLSVMLALAYPRSVRAVGSARRLQALEHDLTAARDDAERVALVNETLAELEHELGARAWLPRAAAWLGVTGTGLALVGGILVGPKPEMAAAVAIAALGVIGCFAAGRLGRRLGARARAAIDRRIEALVGALYAAEVVLPAARGRRGSIRAKASTSRTSGRLDRQELSASFTDRGSCRDLDPPVDPV